MRREITNSWFICVCCARQQSKEVILGVQLLMRAPDSGQLVMKDQPGFLAADIKAPVLIKRSKNLSSEGGGGER